MFIILNRPLICNVWNWDERKDEAVHSLVGLDSLTAYQVSECSPANDDLTVVDIIGIGCVVLPNDCWSEIFVN